MTLSDGLWPSLREDVIDDWRSCDIQRLYHQFVWLFLILTSLSELTGRRYLDQYFVLRRRLISTNYETVHLLRQHILILSPTIRMLTKS